MLILAVQTLFVGTIFRLTLLEEIGQKSYFSIKRWLSKSDSHIFLLNFYYDITNVIDGFPSVGLGVSPNILGEIYIGSKYPLGFELTVIPLGKIKMLPGSK